MRPDDKKDLEALEPNEEKLQGKLSIEEMAMEQIRIGKEQVQIARQQLTEARWARIIALIGLTLVFLGLIAAIITTYFSYLSISSKVAALDRHVESVETHILAGRFIIISPSDGAIVDLTDIVRIKTPFSQLNHYLIITPLKTGDDWVQDNPPKPDVAGSWVGTARFGSGDAGAGDKFLVRALATSATVPPGLLKSVPPDAVYSESITVTRQK